jgi:putative chitinase
VNKKPFFDSVRGSLYGGGMNIEQVDGLALLLDVWYSHKTYPDYPTEWLAYILATAHWETGGRMQPVREIAKGKGKKYGIPDKNTGHVYYGRGHVQLTWADNYIRMGKIIGRDLYRNPDLALNPVTSANIMFIGMIDGIFTGHKLADFIKPGVSVDYIGARRVVNRLDKAGLIAEMALKYEAALKLMKTEIPPLPPEIPQAPPVPVSRWQSFVATIRRLFGL